MLSMQTWPDDAVQVMETSGWIGGEGRGATPTLMYGYVYICICIRVYVYVCMYIYIYTHICLYNPSIGVYFMLPKNASSLLDTMSSGFSPFTTVPALWQTLLKQCTTNPEPWKHTTSRSMLRFCNLHHRSIRMWGAIYISKYTHYTKL